MRSHFSFNDIESYVAGHARLFISLVISVLVLVTIAALTAFFIVVRGEEQTMVPFVQGKPLTEALLELQVKELYPRIQLRYSQSSVDRGNVLEQDPQGGTIVKAGRRIKLVVSQGIVIDRVGDYIGRSIDEVRIDLQALAASVGSGGIPLSLKEPFMYSHSAEAPGTILEQNPLPGTDISGPTVVQLVVSRGPEYNVVTIPDLVGLSINNALTRMQQSGVIFKFSVRELKAGEKPETIVAQTPPAKAVTPASSFLSLTATVPSVLGEGEVFGLFKYTVPENPYPLPLRLEALLPGGDRQRIVTIEHPGGEFSVPYRLPYGSTLILSLVNRELFREDARPYLQNDKSFEKL